MIFPTGTTETAQHIEFGEHAEKFHAIQWIFEKPITGT
jgi:hypothetical protein